MVEQVEEDPCAEIAWYCEKFRTDAASQTLPSRLYSAARQMWTGPHSFGFFRILH